MKKGKYIQIQQRITHILQTEFTYGTQRIMDHHIIRRNAETLSRKSLLILKTILGLSFVASMILFVHLSIECVTVYRIKNTNKMIEEETSKSLSPFEFSYRGNHKPFGVNKAYRYKLPTKETDGDKSS